LAKGGRKKVGEAYVELRADTTKLGPELEKLRSETAKTAKHVEGDTKKIGDGFSDVGVKIENSTAGFRKFSGALSSTIGIFTGIAGSVAVVSGLIIGLSRNFDLFGRKAAQSIRDVAAEISNLRNTSISLELAESDEQIKEILTQKIAELETAREALLQAGSSGGRATLEKNFPVTKKVAEFFGADISSGEDGALFTKEERRRLDEIESELKLLRQRGSSRLRQLPDTSDQVSPSATRSTSAPLDSGGSLRSAPGGIEQNRELLDLLREIARNTRNQQQ